MTREFKIIVLITARREMYDEVVELWKRAYDYAGPEDTGHSPGNALAEKYFPELGWEGLWNYYWEHDGGLSRWQELQNERRV